MTTGSNTLTTVTKVGKILSLRQNLKVFGNLCRVNFVSGKILNLPTYFGKLFMLFGNFQC